MTAIGTAIAGISVGTLAVAAAVLAAVAAAGVLAWKYWDRVSSVFTGIGRRIMEEFAPAIDWVSGKLSNVRETARGWVGSVAEAMGGNAEAAKASFDAIIDRVFTLDGIKKSLSEFKAWVGSFFAGLFEREILTPEQIANGEKAGYQLADRIITGIKKPFVKLEEIRQRMLTLGGEIVTNLWEGMKATFAEFMAWVQQIPAKIVEAIGNIDLSNIIDWPSPPAWWTKLTGGASPDAPEVDGHRAKGGPISAGGTYLTSEEGPELITPTRSGYVHTAEQTKAMLGGGSGGQAASPSVAYGGHTVNLGGIVINAAPGMDAREVAAEAMRQIEAKIGAALRGVQADTGMEAYG